MMAKARLALPGFRTLIDWGYETILQGSSDARLLVMINCSNRADERFETYQREQWMRWEVVETIEEMRLGQKGKDGEDEEVTCFIHGA